MHQLITSNYEHQLAKAFHAIDNRGLLMDEPKLAKLRLYCNDNVKKICTELSLQTGQHIYVGAENKPAGKAKSVNVNYSPNLQTLLKDIGFTLPKIRVKNKDTHDFEMKDSANKLVLQKVLADPTLWPSNFLSAKQLISSLLELHTILKVKSTYVNARLFNSTLYSCYGVASTITGRRSSRRHPFNLGTNAQNYPKYTALGHQYQEAIVTRPGNIFLRVDLKGAEDWPVSALAANTAALEELRMGINRHIKLASFLFSVPETLLVLGREAGDPTSEFQYFLAKKTRHANNYGLRAQRFSEQLAENGYSVSKEMCTMMLRKVNEVDPSIDAVFHAYIKNEAYTKKLLRTPLGRERQIFGLRSGENNYDILNELYSYVPQSTVGDLTGLAILHTYNSYNGRDYIVHDGHDSVTQEIPDNEQELLKAFKTIKTGYNRDVVFHNGISVNIPLEAEIGYNWGSFKKIKETSEECLIDTYRKVRKTYERNSETEVGEVSQQTA